MAVGSVQFGGLASGLPADIVDQLMKGQQARLTSYQKDKQWFSDQKSGYADLSAKLSALSGKVVALQSAAAWAPHNSSSSDSTKVTITPGSSAAAGSQTLHVGQLATNDTYVMDSGLETATTKLADGSTVKFNYNGTAYDIGNVSGLSLAEVASKINGQNFGSDAGVSASVLSDGSASPYRLVLAAKDSGTKNGAPRIDSISLTNGATASNFTNTVVAQNAIFRVAGVDATSTKNSVSDVLTGVTLELKAVTTGTLVADGKIDPANMGTGVTVSVSNDTSAVKTTLQGFVDAYNEVVNYIRQDKSGVLSSSTAARSVLSQLRAVLNTRTQKGDGSGDLLPYSTLGELGLRTDPKLGTVSLDGAAMDKALLNDFSTVAALFTNTQTSVGVGNNAGLAYRLDTAIKSMTSGTNGTLSSQDIGLQARITRLGKDIERENARLAKVKDGLTQKFSNLEQMVSKMNSAGNAMNGALSKM